MFSGGYTNRDFETLIEAVRGTEHELVLCVVPENRLPDDIPDNVELIYNEGPEEFSEYLSAGALGVVPLYAGRGGAGYSVLVEHFMNGQPTIASDENMRDYVVESACRLVPPGDVAAMRRAIDDVMSEPETRAQMGIEGRKLYEQRFSTRAVATLLIQSLDHVNLQ